MRTAGHERLREVPVLAPQYLRTGLVRSVLRGMDRIRWYDTDSALAAVTVPVTLVRGEHDHIAPRSWVDRLARAGGHHAVATVAGGGHLVPLTHPEAVARAIQDIVARRGVAGPTPPPGPPRPDADGC